MVLSSSITCPMYVDELRNYVARVFFETVNEILSAEPATNSRYEKALKAEQEFGKALDRNDVTKWCNAYANSARVAVRKLIERAYPDCSRTVVQEKDSLKLLYDDLRARGRNTSPDERGKFYDICENTAKKYPELEELAHLYMDAVKVHCSGCHHHHCNCD